MDEFPDWPINASVECSRTVYNVADPPRFDRRAPTVAFTLEGYTPRQVAEQLGQAGIFVWDGNYYALAVIERLGVEEHGGMVRVGIAIPIRWGKWSGCWPWSANWPNILKAERNRRLIPMPQVLRRPRRPSNY